jgi:cytochrome b
MGGEGAPSSSVRVWDIPVRVGHWLVVGLVAFSWLSAKQGWISWHKLSGYAILSFVLFRVYWGFAGSSTARFSHFLKGPNAVGRYIRTFFSGRAYAASIGHNPLGGWSIIAMLLLLALQTGLGLFAIDEYGIEGGPLSTYVSFDTGRQVAGWHATVFNLLLFFIALHVTAIVIYLLFKRENLVAPMLTGSKRMVENGAALNFATAKQALGAVVVSVAFVAVVVFFF